LEESNCPICLSDDEWPAAKTWLFARNMAAHVCCLNPQNFGLILIPSHLVWRNID